MVKRLDAEGSPITSLKGMSSVTRNSAPLASRAVADLARGERSHATSEFLAGSMHMEVAMDHNPEPPRNTSTRADEIVASLAPIFTDWPVDQLHALAQDAAEREAALFERTGWSRPAQGGGYIPHSSTYT